MDGDHTIETTAEVQEKVLVEVYKACSENKVFLEGTLLKPSMTVSGADNKNKAGSEEVAKMTVRTMNRCVPAAVPGIMFLSGGLTEEDASVYLNTMNSIEHKSATSLTFSYGRALQQSALKFWSKDIKNVNEYPSGVSMSRIFLKILLTDENDSVIEKTIEFEIPMGC